MMMLASSQTILIIIISIVAFVILMIALFFLLKSQRKKSILKKLDTLLNDVNSINKSQIDIYLVRLKKISEKNDNYVEVYNQISIQFERLLSVDKEKLIQRQNGLKERISNEKNIKNSLFGQIKSFEKAINQYKSDISRIQIDLENYFKESDELRIRSTELQKKYHQVTEDMVKYSQSLTICEAPLKSYLADIEMYFEIFDGNLSSAKYKEAKKNLEVIESLLVNVSGNIEKIAQYCKMVETIIPNELNQLLEKIDELVKKGYVIAQKKVVDFVDYARKILEENKAKFMALCFGDFETDLKMIQDSLADIYSLLNEEVKSKNELDEKYSIVNRKINNSQSEFIKIKRQYFVMNEYYSMTYEIKERFDNFQKDATMLGDLYREYQGYEFARTKNPASFMLNKVNKMDEICNKIDDDINFFSSYFYDIKVHVETCFNKVSDLAVQIVKLVGNVRYYRAEQIYNKYFKEVKTAQLALQNVKSLLLDKPIDLDNLHSIYTKTISYSEDLLIRMKNELNEYLLVEKSIVYANPLRHQFNNVNNSLNEIEQLFKDGNYRQAQEGLNMILNDYHPVGYDSFKR